ncbi:ATP-dependent endonuclease [[Kitasatospora] papulosa]|uniref:ATP-dependent nuclease n=1 Tax=[Kitasatospora] papulosa TaxID=1464011 RepID=UPI0036763FA4
MYLAHLRVENFRAFGPAAQGDDERDDALSLSFTAGTNVLVGENDSGKTAIVDAIRLCLQSAASDYYRVSQDAFHLGKDGRAETSTIGCAFTDLSTEEQAVFLELLTHDRDGTAWLCVTFKAQRMDPLRNRVSVTTRTGRQWPRPGRRCSRTPARHLPAPASRCRGGTALGPRVAVVPDPRRLPGEEGPGRRRLRPDR